MTAAMAELAHALGERPGIRLVSITVDPEHDSPAVLAEYAGRYGADPARWLFLTGERPAIERLARESFHLAAGEGDAAGGGEPFLHSTRLVLVDGEGRIRGTYDGTDAARVRALRAELEALLAEKPS
jgi:protein SCO1/2